MNQVLGRTAGNAVEVRESIDQLTGAASDPRLREVTLALSAELLVLGGVHRRRRRRPRGCRARTRRAARAAERFAAMVAELGGPADLLERPDRHLPCGAGRPRRSAAVEAGVVSAVDVARRRDRDHRPRRRPGARDRRRSTTASA